MSHHLIPEKSVDSASTSSEQLPIESTLLSIMFKLLNKLLLLLLLLLRLLTRLQSVCVKSLAHNCVWSQIKFCSLQHSVKRKLDANESGSRDSFFLVQYGKQRVRRAVVVVLFRLCNGDSITGDGDPQGFGSTSMRSLLSANRCVPSYGGVANRSNVARELRFCCSFSMSLSISTFSQFRLSRPKNV